MIELADLFIAPLQGPVDPSKRLFWMFLLSSLLMASLAVSWRSRQFNLARQVSALFSKQYWLHRSNATDAGLLLLNHALHILLIIPLVGSYLAGAVAVGSVMQSQFGDAPDLPGSTLAVGIAYTLVLFLMEDLSRFGLHRAFHRFPLAMAFSSHAPQRHESHTTHGAPRTPRGILRLFFSRLHCFQRGQWLISVPVRRSPQRYRHPRRGLSWLPVQLFWCQFTAYPHLAGVWPTGAAPHQSGTTPNSPQRCVAPPG